MRIFGDVLPTISIWREWPVDNQGEPQDDEGAITNYVGDILNIEWRCYGIALCVFNIRRRGA